MKAVTRPANITQRQADKAVREYLQERAGFDNYGSWSEEPVQRPEMQVDGPDRFVNPVGFVDFRFKHMKTEQKRNIGERHCRISRVKLK